MKIKATGRAMVITSDLTVDQIKLLSKTNANKIQDTRGNDVYLVGMGATGDFKPYGVSFTDADAEGKAQLTISLPCAAQEAKQYIEDTFTPAIVAMSEYVPVLVDRAAEVAGVIEEAMALVEVDA